MKNDFNVFAQNLTNLRIKHKLSKVKMAKTLGISVASLNKVEKGILPPRMDVCVIFRVCDAFGVLPQNLFKENYI